MTDADMEAHILNLNLDLATELGGNCCDPSNLSRLFSQGRHYARKNGELQ